MVLLQPAVNLLHDAPLFILAVAVEAIEPGSEFLSTSTILDAEEFDNVSRYIHASGCIKPRRDPKCHFARSERARSSKISHFQQGLQTGIDGSPQGFKPELCKY